ncbi:chromosome partitioning protein [Micromonospora endophytica]|uniref:MinD/ParA family ATP-binding protein n=1 Tax=Micromonospora endophytica TaxID=515350 RepID=UPI003B8394F3
MGPGTGYSAVPPSPSDYPSLTGGGPSATGWGPPTPPVPAPPVPAPPSPPANTWQTAPAVPGGEVDRPSATGWEPPPGGPRRETARVDLDQPFTLDQPTSLAAPREVTPPGPAPVAPDHTGPGVAGEVADAPADSAVDDPQRSGQAPPVARPQATSPWAQPPQRPAPEAAAPVPTGEASAGAPPPAWAAPVPPLPPVAPHLPGPPIPRQTSPHPPVPPHPNPTPIPHHDPATAPIPHHDPVPTPLSQHDPMAVPQHDPVPAPSPHEGAVPPAPVVGPAENGPPVAPYTGSVAAPTEPPYASSPPGPFPPQPAWNPPPWQQHGAPPPLAHPLPHQAYQPAETASRVPPAYAEQDWNPDLGGAPTAEDFARRRQVRPADPVATMGVRAVVNKTGLVKLPPGRHELELKRDIETVRRNFGGLRQVTVVNPKGGAGKTVAILLLAMTFGQKRGGYVLAWDNNETQGTLGMRAQQDFHSRTVRDLLRDLGQFHGAHGRVGDLSQYVRSQGEGMFDVLASDESATGGEMLTAAAFGEIREVVSRFYKLIFVDTGNNVRAQNWQAAMDATDQLLVTMSARNDSAETAARMLDHLEQSGRQRLVRQAVTVVSMPPSRKEIDLPAIEEHFAARTRAVLLAPYERLIDTGEPIRYAQLSAATRDAWLKIAAAVAEGL